MKPKILIIGSNGFIGSNLAEYMATPFLVTTTSRTPAFAENHFAIDPTSQTFRSLVDQLQPDVCINCIGAANVNASFDTLAQDFELNVVRLQSILTTLHLLAPKCRFIHLSSAAVYGNTPTLPILETVTPNPISPYGWHKLQAEQVCKEFQFLGRVKVISLRLFSVFGPGLRRQLLWDVYRKSKAGHQIELAGTGLEARDFIYIKDLVRAIALIAMNPGLFDGEALNVATGEMVTVRRAATCLLKNLGWVGELTFSSNERQGDPSKFQADISRLNRLGFQSNYEFETAIEEVAEWMRLL